MKLRWVVGLAGLGLVASVAIAICLGPADLTLAEVFQSLRNHLGWPATEGAPLSAARDAIVWQIRLPRALTAVLAGMGLAVCGSVMQAVSRNPLADPYLLGLSGGASLGAVLVLLAGWAVMLPVASFAGAAIALVVSLVLAGATGRLTATRTILAGLAVGQACSAGVSLVIFTSAQGDSFREVLSWLMGSLAGTGWDSAALVGVAVASVGLMLMLTGRLLDTFTFGDTTAAALGVRVGLVRGLLLTAVALLAGLIVCQTGAIGFVGLVVPHGARLLVGARNSAVLPLSGLLGGLCLVWADTAARLVVAPSELPVGVVTAAVGAPAFGVLLWRDKERG
jgi:iron complex transport system permease protein